jgi:glycerol-3-phosphate dehydrogenase
MAEDTLEQAILIGDLDPRPCITHTLQIHGYHKHSANFGDLEVYGSDAVEIQNLVHKNPALGKKIHENLEPIEAEVLWAVREEMARTATDFLARRTRSLLLNAKVSLEMAARVSKIMAKELNKHDNWVKNQVENFKKIASNFIV